jgi:hypothetical protein
MGAAWIAAGMLLLAPAFAAGRFRHQSALGCRGRRSAQLDWTLPQFSRTQIPAGFLL